MKLDFIENIEIHQGTPLVNYHSILHLKEGIFMTYENMINLQENYHQIADPGLSPEQIEILKSSSLSISGKLNRADSMGINLMHWYSINLVNFANCCGLVKFLNERGIQPEKLSEDRKMRDDLKECQKDYINSIPELTPVKYFRHKASAHLAFTAPQKDNAATLVESISLIPSFVNGKLTIGTLKRGKGDVMSGFGDHEWNLVDNFDSLINRYFINDF